MNLPDISSGNRWLSGCSVAAPEIVKALSIVRGLVCFLIKSQNVLQETP